MSYQDHLGLRYQVEPLPGITITSTMLNHYQVLPSPLPGLIITSTKCYHYQYKVLPLPVPSVTITRLHKKLELSESSCRSVTAIDYPPSSAQTELPNRALSNRLVPPRLQELRRFVLWTGPGSYDLESASGQTTNLPPIALISLHQSFTWKPTRDQ